jgi:hypothetical protein
MSLFSVDLTSLIRELQQLKFNQQFQQNQIIALLQEQNQLLKQLLPK